MPKTLAEVIEELEACCPNPMGTEPIEVPAELMRDTLRKMKIFSMSLESMHKDGGMVGLLVRSLAIITDAIGHGMPITPEIADVRNRIVEIKTLEEKLVELDNAEQVAEEYGDRDFASRMGLQSISNEKVEIIRIVTSERE